jgi:hypothetical protein
MGGGVAGGRSIRFIVHLPLGAMTAGLGGERAWRGRCSPSSTTT